jgi:Tol biopolymer transport system component/tRNA A-37 threonylcarbamoyl transferase component Bud32
MGVDLSRWPDADDILDAALSLPEHERRSFVRGAAASPELAAALEAVLAEASAADGFLSPDALWSGALGREVRELIGDEPPALAAGSHIDHYEVLTPIGRGGMGEVYRARDTRLGRDVALKVLPARYARDHERRARFQREARVLASLNHSGIAAIFGVAETDDVEALVLEFVEGPTLAELVAQGPRPIDEILAVSAALVDAIGAAHARGILHRDLKPANIKITEDAGVKILDFGLARVLGVDRQSELMAPDLTRHSAPALLGTASYMSPEQARGEPVDERTDVWAFGCVLFEMLTGVRAFGGDSTADVLAAVIERAPNYSLLPPHTPEPLRRLLRRCLDKNPDRRLGFIGDARLELEDAAEQLPSAPEALDAGTPGAGARRSRLWMLFAAPALVAAGAGTALWYLGSVGTTTPPRARLAITLPAGDRPVTAFQPMVAISPDGRTVVYRASRGGTTYLFRRDLDALEPSVLAGTEGASSPMFSPDGRWLAFDADGVLKRVAAAGGTPVAICSAPGGVTGVWLPGDVIVFATNTGRVLQRVSASGGTPQPLTVLDHSRGDIRHLLPQAIPGTRSVLFTVAAGATHHIATVDLDTGAVRLLTEGSHATFVPPDEIVFAREGSLWGARLDRPRTALLGQAVPLEERVAHTDNTVFHYAAASTALVYLPSQSEVGRQRLVWIDRQGREAPVDVDPGPFVRVSLSRDGRLALALDEQGNQDIWVADPARSAMTRLTFEPTIETMPAWSPDGRFVTFRSEREGPGVFRRDAQGTGPIERLTSTDGPIHSPYSWTPDGRTLLLAVFRSFRHQAIGSVTPPDTTVRILLDGNYAQLNPQVSPDGRWLAYQSDETGRFEVYVRPYPDVDAGRWLISTAGGTSPRWSRDGRELFYYDGQAIASVTIAAAGPALVAGRPTSLFAVKPFGGRLGPGFEVSPDGQRFLFLLPTAMDTPRAASLVLVQNWAQGLTTRPAARR